MDAGRRPSAGMVSQAGSDATVLDLKELPTACFSPTAFGKVKPEGFEPFQQQVLDADGILFIVPEYNGSYPGILKHFIDLWQYPVGLRKPPRCVFGVAAGQWGGLRAVEHLQGVMGYRNARPFPCASLLTISMSDGIGSGLP